MNIALFKKAVCLRSLLRPQRTWSMPFSSSPCIHAVKTKFEFLELEQPSPFVTHVKINRPDKMNALNFKLWGELKAVFEELSEDVDCRAIVISGNGSMFTSGIDLKDMMELVSGIVKAEEDIARKTIKLFKIIRQVQLSFTNMEKCPKPVIAAVHNGCIGDGISLITAVDVRLCTKDAWFQAKQVDVGFADDVGGLQRLPKVIGNESLARELCFTGRKMDSKEAARCGLVSKVHEDKESMVRAALDMAKDIAERSPVAVQGTKVNLNFARDHSVDEGLEFVARWNSTMLQSDDLMKAGMAAASKSKEPPTFAKL